MRNQRDLYGRVLETRDAYASAVTALLVNHLLAFENVPAGDYPIRGLSGPYTILDHDGCVPFGIHTAPMSALWFLARKHPGVSAGDRLRAIRVYHRFFGGKQ